LEALVVLLTLMTNGEQQLDFEKLLVLKTLEFLEQQELLKTQKVQVYLIQLLMQ
jgi:hypothetical protein